MAKEKIENHPIVNPGDLRGLLHEYREKAGYSLNQMADALCLSEETIEKLENEEFQALAEPPYIRGYLRNYAKIAEADPSELINRYEALRGADPSELDYHFKKSTIHSKSTRRMSPVFAQLFFLALLIAFLAGISMIPGVQKWMSETWESITTQTATQDVISTDNPLLTGRMPVPTQLPIDEKPAAPNARNAVNTNTPTETQAPPVTEANGEAKKEDPLKATTDNQTTQQQEQTASQQAQTETEEKKEKPSTTNTDLINIRLVFNKEVWLRIRDKEKKTLFEATNTAGNEKTLELKKPITFRVGNAQGLSLFVDNKPVDISSYIKGSVANFTLE